MRHPKQLLLIDHNESIRKMIAFIFDKQNDHINSIADIMLGTEDGREIYQYLKQLPAIAQVPLSCCQPLLLAKNPAIADRIC